MVLCFRTEIGRRGGFPRMSWFWLLCLLRSGTCSVQCPNYGLALGIIMGLWTCIFARMSDDLVVFHLRSPDCVRVCCNIMKLIPDWVGNRFSTGSAFENGPFQYGECSWKWTVSVLQFWYRNVFFGWLRTLISLAVAGEVAWISLRDINFEQTLFFCWR